MKKLIYLLLFFPLLAQAQINGTIQKTVVTGIIRGSFGSSGIDTLPPVKALATFTNGQTMIWDSTLKKFIAAPAGITSVGTFGSTPNANGASVSSGVITLQPASASFPGGVTTGAQTFAGDKAYTGTVNSSVYISALSSGRGWIMNAGVVPSLVSYSNYGANSYIDWVKGGTAKWRVGFNGTNSDYSIRNSTNATNVLVVDTLNNITISSLTNGLVKSTSGTLSNATAGTDYLTPTGSGTGLSGVVLKAGDTMTGNLLAPSISLTPASSNNGLSINRSGLNASPISINETGGSSNASIEISNTGNTASGGVESIFSGTSQTGIGFKVTGNSTYAGDPFRYVKNGSTLFNVDNAGALTGTSASFSTATNGIVGVNRGSTSFASIFKVATAGTDNWAMGQPTGATTNWTLFNYGLNLPAITVDYATNAVTLTGAVSGTSATLTGALSGTSATLSAGLTISGGGLTSNAGATVAGTGVPFIINSTNSNTFKLGLQDNGVIRGYIGATATNSTEFGNAGGSQVATINGTTGAYTATSDSRWKTNILPSASALPLLKEIEVVSYDWKGSILKEPFGVTAQQLHTVLPAYVSKPEKAEDKWGVSKAEMVPMLVKAIQEQQAIITALEARIKALELKP